MTGSEGAAPASWTDGELPANVSAGQGTVIRHSPDAFRRFRARQPQALRIGARCALDSVRFAVGPEGSLRIGDDCVFSSTVLLCEMRIEIGSFVVVGWNTTIADSDFHPLDPAARLQDAIACSPLGRGLARPPVVCKPVFIEDHVWIGPSATILKGVRLGEGCFVEPGAVVSGDVPPRARVLGSPARIIGTV